MGKTKIRRSELRKNEIINAKIIKNRIELTIDRRLKKKKSTPQK